MPKLPSRHESKYTDILDFEKYELTHCIAYELASRNHEVIELKKRIDELELIYKHIFTIQRYKKFDELMPELINLIKNDSLLSEIYKNSSIDYIDAKVMYETARLKTELEEEHYYIYNTEEMENTFNVPHHYEPDEELNKHMEKVLLQEFTTLDNDDRYKVNFKKKDGYVIYQGAYQDSLNYDINKIFPNFKKPIKEFNQTQVAFNMSLPKDELIAYITKIKDDYDNNTDNSYKNIHELLENDEYYFNSTKLEHKKQLERYIDDFFIYDYYEQSKENENLKISEIQEELSKFHGMKKELSRNNYEIINYYKAHKTSQQKFSSVTMEDLVKLATQVPNIKHFLEEETIKERYTTIKNAIDSKEYKALIFNITKQE